MNRRTAIVGGGLAALIAAIVIAGFLISSGSRNQSFDGRPTPTPTQTNAKVDVERAYLSHWDAYTVALLTLDAAPLERVMTGVALEKSKAVVDEQRQKNQPVRVRVEHNYRIILVKDDFASVDDTFIDHSVRLDPNSKEPVEQDPNKSVRNSYTLRKVGGKWKVAEIIGYEGSPSP